MPKFFDEKRVALLISLLKPNRKTRVLDVGANPINDTPYKSLLKMGGCEVWGFEPQPEAYEKLQEIKGDAEEYLPYAIGDGKTGILNVCNSDGFSSLYKPNVKTLDFLARWHKAMTVKERMPLETKRLDDLEELPKPDLLKIDVQGAEVSVFENGTSKLSDCVSVISEVAFVPLYEGQPLLHDQMREMEKQGFLLSKFMFLKAKALGGALMESINWRKHQNQLIDGDAVFIRNLIDPDIYTDEQLKHLAICADAIFESFDLTLRCLSILLERGKIQKSSVETYSKLIPFQKDP